MVENGFVNTKLNATTMAVLHSPTLKYKWNFIKMLGWMEVNIFQDFNRIPELAFLKVIRDLASMETAI